MNYILCFFVRRTNTSFYGLGYGDHFEMGARIFNYLLLIYYYLYCRE